MYPEGKPYRCMSDSVSLSEYFKVVDVIFFL